MARSRFRFCDGVLASADDRVVQLKFTNVIEDGESACLFAHPCVLSSWSRVLANVLEDAQHSDSQPANRAAEAAASSSTNGAKVQLHTIPLDDPEITAWEDALCLMYPSVPLFEINWSNAARLLLLADKYDMPCLLEHVKAFLDTPQQAFMSAGTGVIMPVRLRLEAQLSDGRKPTLPANLPCVFEWLKVTSKCGLEQHAQICIKHIVRHQLEIPAGLVSSIRPQHAEQLLTSLQQALQQARGLLQSAALPCQDRVCGACHRPWFYKPPGIDHSGRNGWQNLDTTNGSSASVCIHCGHRLYRYRRHYRRLSDDSEDEAPQGPLVGVGPPFPDSDFEGNNGSSSDEGDESEESESDSESESESDSESESEDEDESGLESSEDEGESDEGELDDDLDEDSMDSSSEEDE